MFNVSYIIRFSFSRTNSEICNDRITGNNSSWPVPRAPSQTIPNTASLCAFFCYGNLAGACGRGFIVARNMSSLSCVVVFAHGRVRTLNAKCVAKYQFYLGICIWRRLSRGINTHQIRRDKCCATTDVCVCVFSCVFAYVYRISKYEHRIFPRGWAERSDPSRTRVIWMKTLARAHSFARTWAVNSI